MSALPNPMSLEAFIAWEERQEPRYEFDGAEIEEVEGATTASALIQADLRANLGASLRGSRQAIVGGLLKIRTPVSIRYPDAMAVDATTHEIVAADGVLAMSEIGVELPLAACCEGVDLAA